MKMIIVFAALIAANLAACGQQEQSTEEVQAPVATEVETPPTDAGMEAAPVEVEVPALEGVEEPVEAEAEANEEPPVG